MNKFLRRGVSAVLAAGVVGAAIWAPLSTAQNEDTYESLKLFGDVFDTVRANYVEEVDDEALIRAAIQGMLQSLDPHSGYEPPEAYEETRSDVRGTFGGIGIQVTMEEGYVKVIAPIDDPPGARAGGGGRGARGGGRVGAAADGGRDDGGDDAGAIGGADGGEESVEKPVARGNEAGEEPEELLS